ncbi:MAG: DDE-type integrase/transposase/recombinase, partial [Proteobacteria bacterium]|nr:DDE-type integrase/transposase/recombinase [Pseudomonadota bacterium]
AYASRLLSKTEKNYDAHKLEFLALKWSVTERFHEYLYGGKFDVYTDNNPLTYILTTAKLDATGQRWIANLASYDFKIFYRSGHLNVDADALSRIPWELQSVRENPLDEVLAKSVMIRSGMHVKIPMFPNAVILTHELIIRSDLQLTKSQWRQEQSNDYSVKRLIELLETDKLTDYVTKSQDPPDLKCMLRLRKDFFMDQKLLYRKAYFKLTDKRVNQFVMPQQFRKCTVQVVHEDYGHLGMDRVLILLQERFYWPKMSEDVRDFIRSCDRCVRFKQKPQKDKLYPLTATYPLELIHLDFLTIGGKGDVLKNILVVTDHFTRYAQCFITSNQSAITVADTLVNKYFAHYGWPDKILTDRGGSFESHLFKEICEMAKVKKLRTSSYHPQTNGQCERFNKTLISMLGTLPNSAKKNWQDWVPTLVHAYNCTTSGVTGYSPYFLIYGRQPKLPIDIEYGVAIPDSYMDCKTYADKLQYRLQ